MTITCPECIKLTRPCAKHLPYPRKALGLLFDTLTSQSHKMDAQASHVVMRTMQHLDNERMANTFPAIDSTGNVMSFSTVD